MGLRKVKFLVRVSIITRLGLGAGAQNYSVQNQNPHPLQALHTMLDWNHCEAVAVEITLTLVVFFDRPVWSFNSHCCLRVVAYVASVEAACYGALSFISFAKVRAPTYASSATVK